MGVQDRHTSYNKQLYIKGESKLQQEIDHAYGVPNANRRLINKMYMSMVVGEQLKDKTKKEEVLEKHGRYSFPVIED